MAWDRSPKSCPIWDIPVTACDSDMDCHDEYERSFPAVTTGGDISSSFSDVDFVAALSTADVTFATPPCRTFSPAGLRTLDAEPDGQLLAGHVRDVLTSASPLAHFVETSATLLEDSCRRVL